ncbi:unnamed protein product [Chilo suppressalis]|uniref:TIL domain-containing protein n=1 Tax=Chilo suppressalis TaxID=168631 RepID=A0ABN8B1E2_CHISP|nr:unnamed protein product [Chilo suppressalis]
MLLVYTWSVLCVLSLHFLDCDGQFVKLRGNPRSSPVPFPACRADNIDCLRRGIRTFFVLMDQGHVGMETVDPYIVNSVALSLPEDKMSILLRRANVTEHNLSWNNCIDICTDGAKAMTARRFLNPRKINLRLRGARVNMKMLYLLRVYRAVHFCQPSDQCIVWREGPSRFYALKPNVVLTKYFTNVPLNVNPIIALTPFPCNRPNEVYNECPPLCPTDKCTDATVTGECPYFWAFLTVIECSPKCRCKQNYWRNNDVCVPYDECYEVETNITYPWRGIKGIDNEDYILIGSERIAVRNTRTPSYFLQPNTEDTFTIDTILQQKQSVLDHLANEITTALMHTVVDNFRLFASKVPFLTSSHNKPEKTTSGGTP